MDRIATALVAASMIYNEPMEQDRIKGYLAALEGINQNDVVSAINKLVKTCKFFPKPSEIIEAVSGEALRRKMIGTTDDIPEMQAHAREEVTELLSEFRKKMKWE